MATPDVHIPITVGEVLRSTDPDHVTTCDAHMGVAEAARQMLESDLRWMLVAHDGETVGVVTWRELLHVLAEQASRAGEIDLGQIAWRGPLSVTESTPVEEVCRVMFERDVRYATVRRGGSVIGLLTLSDVLRKRLQKEEQITEELAAYIAQDYPR
jgi:CBS domain-containing protein